jgi:hypothetical protein
VDNLQAAVCTVINILGLENSRKFFTSRKMIMKIGIAFLEMRTITSDKKI